MGDLLGINGINMMMDLCQIDMGRMFDQVWDSYMYDNFAELVGNDIDLKELSSPNIRMNIYVFTYIFSLFLYFTHTNTLKDWVPSNQMRRLRMNMHLSDMIAQINIVRKCLPGIGAKTCNTIIPLSLLRFPFL